MSEKRTLFPVEDIAQVLEMPVEDVQHLIDQGTLTTVDRRRKLVPRWSIEQYWEASGRGPEPAPIEERLHKRKAGLGSIWHCKYRDMWIYAVPLEKKDGKRQRKTLTSVYEEAIWEKYFTFLEEQAKGAPREEPAPTPPISRQPDSFTYQSGEVPETLGELFQMYLRSIQYGASSRAYKDKVRDFQRIARDIGDCPLNGLTQTTIRQYLNRLSNTTYEKGRKKGQYYSQTQIHKYFILLRSALSEAVDNGYLPRSFTKRLKEPPSKRPYTEKVNVLEPEERQMILAAMQGHTMLNAIAQIAACCGMRPGEIYALKFNDFNFTQQTISISRNLSVAYDVDPDTGLISNERYQVKQLKNEWHTRRNRYATRRLKVSPGVLEAVERLRAEIESDPEHMSLREQCGTTEFLFTHKNSGDLQVPEYYSRIYAFQLKKHGLEHTRYNLYRFRHTYCTELCKVIHDIKTIQHLMGDSSIELILDVYNSVNNQDILDASALVVESMSVFD